MSVIVNFAIFPLDKGSSGSEYVARAVKVIQESGLAYRLHSMGTCLEGDWEPVMSVVTRCFRELERDCGRVYLTLNADYRQGTSPRMESKVQSVLEKL